MHAEAAQRTLSNQTMRWMSYQAMKMMSIMYSSGWLTIVKCFFVFTCVLTVIVFWPVDVQCLLNFTALIRLRRITFQSSETPGPLS